MDAVWALFATAALATSAVGVTYDWQPINDSQGGAEYVVQVEPELVDAVRRGGLEAIESNVPAGIGPIRRIRIVFGGTEPASSVIGTVDARQKERSVAKPVVADELSPTAKRHTVRQSGTSGQPLQNFTGQLNTAAGQLEQGFSQATTGVQNGFDQAGQAFTNTQNAFAQPFAAQPVNEPRKSLGSELLKGANRLRKNTRSAIRNTGEAIDGTVRNVGDGLKTVLTGGQQPAPAPAAAGSGQFVPFSYGAAQPNLGQPAISQPTGTQPAFGPNPVLSAAGANTSQVSAQPQAFAGSGTNQNTAAIGNEPWQGSGFDNQFGQQPARQQPVGRQSPNGFVSNQVAPASNRQPALPANSQQPQWNDLRNTASNQPPALDSSFGGEQPFVPLVDPRSNLVPVRTVGDTNPTTPGATGNGGFGDWRTNPNGSGPQLNSPSPSPAPGFATAPGNGLGLGTNGQAGWSSEASGTQSFPPLNTNPSNPTIGAGPFATGPTTNASTPPMMPPNLPPLGNPNVAPIGIGNNAEFTPGQQPLGPQPGQPYYNAAGNLPNSPPGEKPWGLFVLTSLACLGSLGGNLFLGWSYFDARHKYHSALRRTVRGFTRNDES